MAENTKKRQRRGRGEGAFYFDEARGLWAHTVSLPSHEFDANGKPKRRRKTIRGKDKNELIRRANKLRAQFEKSGDLPTASQTVESWFGYWLREIVEKQERPGTVKSYRSIVKNHIIPAIGKIRLDKVNADSVRRVTRTMETKGLASTYRRNAFSCMSGAFRAAEREGRIGRNPCDLMDAPLARVPDLEVLTLEESAQLIASLSAATDATESYLWITYLLTGARRGEILGLEWDRVTDELDLSWQLQRITWTHGCGEDPGKGNPWPCGYKRANSCPKKHLVLPDDYEYRHVEGGLYLTRPKTSSGWRIIPLVEPLAGILARWRDVVPPNPHGLVFARPDGRPFDPDDIMAAWLEVLKQAGIDKYVRIHDIRHTTADLLYLANVPEDVIPLILGHSTRAMSRSYKSKGNRVRLVSALQQMSSLLGYEQTAIES